ncbi:3-dehydro-L-gulonate 2-dehydrogenase [Chitinophaga pendula]|uniref:3-dehydro-L-gulonate 2-dehydrogenase n=1 Tax=Chitinophaga TaxID=79328 RepID=UPI000BAE93E6|nr:MULTISPECIES: 3-dehydro-L-gulonate 2-dehydrogenase [Chitinophaga]ASZ10176.1 3-dehydro-L-gulonate 2-dehydrogenase [Chitinophaga sp. MD30]UCJ06869.1 3-dehydro-L-gulonate 2-dehydrogenase [Chitinophaga pendula]
MRIPFDTLKNEFRRVLLELSFTTEKADRCAGIFAANSRDGVHSHGLNRFPVFVQLVRDGFVDLAASPEVVTQQGGFALWDGRQGPGMYNASLCMEHAVALAKTQGIGCVTIRNNNHWMRGGTYGWQAADAGCVGICFTNAIAGMPAWGGSTPVLGNNPLVIAVPRQEGHVVLDMAMSQYSFGKMQEYELRGEQLPFPGGYDEQGQLTADPAVIRQTKRALPIGYWKGSGLALLLDILLTALGGGRSTRDITNDGREYGVSQCFIAIHREDMHEALIDAILDYTRHSAGGAGEQVSYPGERTLRTRQESEAAGVWVNEQIWEQVLGL